MIHDDRNKFSELIDRIASRTGFYAPLIEKDYYLTILLSQISRLSENLFLKGGTCLNKIYYSYYRLSEDLDFGMKLSESNTNRGTRRRHIKPVKDRIESFVKSFGMDIENIENAGRNTSKQYVYTLIYNSVILLTKQTIKVEISLRFNPIDNIEIHRVKHKYLHSFTGEPLFDGGSVNCLSLNEVISEKMRAAAMRLTAAPRDFYDLDAVIRNGFNITDKKVMELFKKKILEDGGDTDLRRYRINLGRSEVEIKEMCSRIEEELYSVLTEEEKHRFDIDEALERINAVMKRLS